MSTRRHLVWDVLVPILIALAFPGIAAAVGVLGDTDPLVVTVAVGGMVCLGSIVINQYDSWRSGIRGLPEGAALVRIIDTWLGDAGLTRGTSQMEGYDHALEVWSPQLNLKAWIGLDSRRSVLAIASAISDQSDGHIAKLLADPQLALDVRLEIGRFGAYYSTVDSPPVYQIIFWTTLPVDKSLTSGRLLERLDFVSRVYYLIGLVIGRHAVVTLRQPASPPSVNWAAVSDQFDKLVRKADSETE